VASASEKWRSGALEAYGAAYHAPGAAHVKSDDVESRSKVYEAIVKGDVRRPRPAGVLQRSRA